MIYIFINKSGIFGKSYLAELMANYKLYLENNIRWRNACFKLIV